MKAEFNININFSVKAELTEGELRALDALVGYGFDSFMKVFKVNLGEHYIGPFEKDMKALFDKIETLRPRISEIDKVRAELGLKRIV